LTQRELADRLHKPQSFVAKYERGERRIDVVEFLVVCQAIGVDSAKLLKALKSAVANDAAVKLWIYYTLVCAAIELFQALAAPSSSPMSRISPSGQRRKVADVLKGRPIRT
jgi:transcriptional regulator with XRE-family HTH domain